MARHSGWPEIEVAGKVIKFAGENAGATSSHVGYWLIGPGAAEFRRSIGCKRWFGVRTVLERRPNTFYFSSIALLTALVVAGFEWVTGPFPWWIALLLVVPASQAGIEIVNALVSRLLPPLLLPSMDFSEGIPDDLKTMVVVPTALAFASKCRTSAGGFGNPLSGESRSQFVLRATHRFWDADREQMPNDSILQGCVEGINRLNERYGSNSAGPFYLFHRPRRWNQAESKWMGYERKRGKLNDFNRLLMGRGKLLRDRGWRPIAPR